MVPVRDAQQPIVVDELQLVGLLVQAQLVEFFSRFEVVDEDGLAIERPAAQGRSALRYPRIQGSS